MSVAAAVLDVATGVTSGAAVGVAQPGSASGQPRAGAGAPCLRCRRLGLRGGAQDPLRDSQAATRRADSGTPAGYQPFAPPPSDDSLGAAGKTGAAASDLGPDSAGGSGARAFPARPDQPSLKEPLAIPEGAVGGEWDFLRWLQARFMGEESLTWKHHDVRAGAQSEDTREKGASWISRMETAQADIKEPPDVEYSRSLLFDEEDEEAYFPDAATEMLWWACVHSNIAAARNALAAGAQVNFTHAKYHERTPLHYAACSGVVNASAVVMLIEAGANVNAQDEAGCRPLHLAPESWDPDKVRALVEAGAEKHHKNAQGYTPLQIARHLYDLCKDPKLERNPGYDPKWEQEMMDLLTYEGSSPYPVLWPLHSEEKKQLNQNIDSEQAWAAPAATERK